MLRRQGGKDANMHPPPACHIHTWVQHRQREDGGQSGATRTHLTSWRNVPQLNIRIKTERNIKVEASVRCKMPNNCWTAKQQRGEVKDKEGYTHGLGMLIQLQAPRAYFLTQRTRANPMRPTVKKHKPALNKTSKQPKEDKSFDEYSLWGVALYVREFSRF